MGLSIARVGDLCSGHGDFPPRAASTGSPNVFINGKKVVRVGDLYDSHTRQVEPHDSHSGYVASSSSTVFVNGIPVARTGDPIDSSPTTDVCDSVVGPGSPDVSGG